MDCSPQGSSDHGILQARKLKWIAISSSRGSSQPWVPCLASRFFTIWVTRKYSLYLRKRGQGAGLGGGGSRAAMQAQGQPQPACGELWAIQGCVWWAEITRSLPRCISWSLFVGHPGEDVQRTQFLGRTPGGSSQLTLPVTGWQVF